MTMAIDHPLHAFSRKVRKSLCHVARSTKGGRMAGAALLRLTREGFGIELRRGSFEIAVDGKSVGTIAWHQTVETPLEPGHHTLRIQADRSSSRTRSFDVADDEVVTFRCHGAMVWPRYVASIVKPDLGISLRRE